MEQQLFCLEIVKIIHVFPVTVIRVFNRSTDAALMLLGTLERPERSKVNGSALQCNYCCIYRYNLRTALVITILVNCLEECKSFLERRNSNELLFIKS